MPDDSAPACPAMLSRFEPKALRTPPDERDLVEAFMERVLAVHPAWPWPLIEEEARRRAKAVLAASVQRRPTEILVAPRRLAGPGRVLLGPGEVDGEFLDQARVAGQAEDEVDPSRLAPGHQRLTGEAAVGPEQG